MYCTLQAGTLLIHRLTEARIYIVVGLSTARLASFPTADQVVRVTGDYTTTAYSPLPYGAQ